MPIEESLRECAEHIEDSITFHSYLETRVNNKKFSKMWECERGDFCDKEGLKKEEKEIQKELNSNRFNIIDGCLYDNKLRALKYSVNYYYFVDDSFFGEK